MFVFDLMKENGPCLAGQVLRILYNLNKKDEFNVQEKVLDNNLHLNAICDVS